MLNQHNLTKVFVARNCDRTSGLTTANLTSNLAQGEIVIVDENGAIIDTAAKAQAAVAIRLMQGIENEPPYVSPLIRKVDLISVKSSKFLQRQEKKVFIGYNTSAGAIDVIAANVYSVMLDGMYKNNPINPSAFVTRAVYESAFSGAVQYDVAKGLVDILAKTYTQFSDGSIRCNIVTDSTLDAVNTITTAEVLEGDTVVSYGGLGGATPAVGDVLSIPGLTGGDHRDEDDTIYSIVYIDATNKIIELDRPYQNRSQASVTISPVADETTGDWGIALEGRSTNNFKVGEASFMEDFTLTTDGFGSTPITKDTDALAIKNGFGRGDQVWNSELWFQGGGSERNKYSEREFQNPVQNVVKNNGYSMINLEYAHNERINTLETNGQPANVKIYLDRNTQALIAADDVATAFGTNIEVGTGLDTIDGSGVLNVINAFAVSAGVLATGANTVANGGKSITAGITKISNGIDV